ncbi:hypothetical protein D9757_006000 [Collybiopsis confluens]|uniref:Uncharacterized protein n=1 Tax=Collybiopsis confluens TaxID=2823264 RepID=A0A8H5HUJ8_9AGAR|nr:hypothetical protein D9757_006000 [Collybiopsis confluens]
MLFAVSGDTFILPEEEYVSMFVDVDLSDPNNSNMQGLNVKHVPRKYRFTLIDDASSLLSDIGHPNLYRLISTKPGDAEYQSKVVFCEEYATSKPAPSELECSSPDQEDIGDFLSPSSPLFDVVPFGSLPPQNLALPSPDSTLDPILLQLEDWPTEFDVLLQQWTNIDELEDPSPSS